MSRLVSKGKEEWSNDVETVWLVLIAYNGQVILDLVIVG